jgi:hypothetical protein
MAQLQIVKKESKKPHWYPPLSQGCALQYADRM